MIELMQWTTSLRGPGRSDHAVPKGDYKVYLTIAKGRDWAMFSGGGGVLGFWGCSIRGADPPPTAT